MLDAPEYFLSLLTPDKSLSLPLDNYNNLEFLRLELEREDSEVDEEENSLYDYYTDYLDYYYYNLNL